VTVTRFQQKRGTSAQWAASVTPLRDGEIGIDKDTGVIKVGDGFTLWAGLPAAFSSQYLPLLGKAADSYRLDGLASTDFLRSNGKAVDSDLLDGHDSSYFLPATGKAVDADKLDGIDSTGFLAATGKAVDSDKLDGIDSTGFALAGDVGQTSPTRKLTTYWGAATSFPSAGVLAGDTVTRSDIGTNGSLWVYVGPGRGVSGWVHKGPIVCLSTTRPASGVSYAGLEIYETDTGKDSYYDGTAWRNGALGISRNLNGTVDILGGAEIQMGMWKLAGSGTGVMSVVLTFPVAFASRPLAVFANTYGYMATSGAWNPGGTVNWEGWTANAGEATATQVMIRLRRNDGATFTTTSDYYFNWLAIGQK
jgi:hypothetical protein